MCVWHECGVVCNVQSVTCVVSGLWMRGVYGVWCGCVMCGVVAAVQCSWGAMGVVRCVVCMLLCTYDIARIVGFQVL